MPHQQRANGVSDGHNNTGYMHAGKGGGAAAYGNNGDDPDNNPAGLEALNEQHHDLANSGDCEHVSLKFTAKMLRHAMTSATNCRNVLLMIDTYLSTAELKFVRGDGVGATSSWEQARNFFCRMLVVGTSIPVARRAPLHYLREIERLLNRLVRFLWVCEKTFINANILLFDLHLNFSLDMDRAVRHNAILSHRLSTDLEQVLASMGGKYEVVKLAEYEQNDRLKSTDAPSPGEGGATSGRGRDVVEGDGSSATDLGSDMLGSGHDLTDSDHATNSVTPTASMKSGTCSIILLFFLLFLFVTSLSVCLSLIHLSPPACAP
jgi:hypothetical protein